MHPKSGSFVSYMPRQVKVDRRPKDNTKWRLKWRKCQTTAKHVRNPKPPAYFAGKGYEMLKSRSPDAKIKRNFTWGEFFPRHMFPNLPMYETAVTWTAVAGMLQPLRDFLDAPLIINNSRQAAGWRGQFDIISEIGAAGALSDHCIFDVNPLATGAVDLICPKFDAYDILDAIRFLSKFGKITVPREAIFEVRNEDEWVHVSFDENIKEELNLPDKFRKARPPRNGNRWWTIRNGIRTPFE